MVDARCSCGAVTLSLPEEPSKIVIACHCLDCQRRTGAPFGVGAYYPADVVTISGISKEFTHAAASGGEIHNYFCPQCALNSLLETQQSARADRRCSRRDGKSKIPGPRQIS